VDNSLYYTLNPLSLIDLEWGKEKEKGKIIDPDTHFSIKNTTAKDGVFYFRIFDNYVNNMYTKENIFLLLFPWYEL
jgi:hypothetical protein